MNALQQLLTDHIAIWTAADTEKKAGRGRSSSNAASVYGIRKLRELILLLAVRGKLVPQDANDEPASALLKRIQAEKARLIAEGKIKEGKPLPVINEEEKTCQLPQSWEWSRIADLTSVLNGRAYAKQELLDSGTPVLRVGNLFTSNDWYYSNLELEEDKYCDAGDLIFSWSASFGPFIWAGPKVIYHYHIWKLNLHSEADLNKNYLYKFLLEKTQEMKAAGHGVSMIHMTKEAMEKMVVPVPPLEEQHRIVAKVDELMTLCDQLETRHNNVAAAHEKLVSHLLGTLTQSQNAADFSANWQRIAAHFDALFTTEASIDALKQTLLQLAVMGKLVPQDPNDEPASALLKRIQAEKAKLVAEGKIKKDKPLAMISENERPFELPKSWEWVKLGDISSTVQYGYTDSANHGSNEVLFLRITDIQGDAVDWTTVPGCDISSTYFDSYMLENNDIVIARTGGTIGKSYLVTGLNQKAVFASYLIRIGNLSATSEQYKKVFLGSQLYWSQLIASSMGTGQPNVNGTALKNLIFSLPPLAEQHRIVAQVDELMTLCDQLKTRLTAANQLQQKLADVVVERAAAR